MSAGTRERRADTARLTDSRVVGTRSTCDRAGGLRALALAFTAGGCAALGSSRAVQSTVTLAPGQIAEGRFETVDGGRSLARFHRKPPCRGVPPHPEATIWTGDGEVWISFPESPLAEERRLGYAQQWLTDGRRVRVAIRNATSHPTTFTWIVVGSSDVVADWDFSGAAEKSER